METRRGAREQPGQPPKLAAVVDHPTRQRRPRYKTLKATLGRPERDTLLVLRRKLAARIDSDDQPGHALAQLVRQFRDVDGQIRAIDVRALKRPRPMRPMMTATMTARSTCQRFNTEWGTGRPNLSSRSRFAVLTGRLIGPVGPGDLRLAATLDDNGGDDQASLRHPPNVAPSTYAYVLKQHTVSPTTVSPTTAGVTFAGVTFVSPTKVIRR
jgi:hypothetical protein